VRFAVAALVVSAAGVLATAAPARAADGDAFAAIVFSPNGKYGFASKASTKDQAIDDAKEQCRATGSLTAVWVENGFVALAIGDNGTVDADTGRTQEEAEQKVLKRVRDAGGVNPHIVICIDSDGN